MELDQEVEEQRLDDLHRRRSERHTDLTDSGVICGGGLGALAAPVIIFNLPDVTHYSSLGGALLEIGLKGIITLCLVGVTAYNGAIVGGLVGHTAYGISRGAEELDKIVRNTYQGFRSIISDE